MRHASLVYLEVSIVLLLWSGLADGVKDIPCRGTTIQTFDQLSRLNNCTVVFGDLILRFPIFQDPDYEPEDINNASLSIREITGFLAVIYVTRLDSLGTLFPQLTIIRGGTLIYDYALFIGDTDLREITLRNLQIIGRGSVGVGGKNPRLCLPTKYDWSLVIRNGTFHDARNGHSYFCEWMRSDRCDSCPRNAHDKCWHNGICQRIEPFYRELNSKFKCHPLCVGGCSNSTSKHCFTCVDIKDGDKCVEKCPEHKFVHETTRRCIEKPECLKMGWKISGSSCVQYCPQNFSSTLSAQDEIDGKTDDGICRPCVVCKKTCHLSGSIRHVQDLEIIGKGCTEIEGTLDINTGRDFEHIQIEFNEYLGQIETIHGCLHIHRSDALTDLKFLSNLRLVTGCQTNISIDIYENWNIQKMLDFHAVGLEKIVVRNGSIRIFNNGRVCPGEVETFIKKLERVKLNEHPEWVLGDYVNENGRDTLCQDATIDLNSYVINYNSVVIRWRDFDPEKHEYYKSFTVSYIPVDPSHSHDQVFDLHPQDSCSKHGWAHMDFARKNLTENSEGYYEIYLTGLEQMMPYDYAIRAYFHNVDDVLIREKHGISPNMDGASTKTKRFRTEMNVPSRVQSFFPTEIKMTSIKLKWTIFEHETDGINFFYIDVEELPMNIEHINDRDYCEYPPELYEKNYTSFLEENFPDEYARSKEDCCQKCCPRPLKPHNITVKVVFPLGEELTKLSDSGNEIYTGMSNRPHLFRKMYTRKEREALIEDLTPFTQYRFNLYVCASETKCSKEEFITQFTDIDQSLDTVNLQVGNYYTEDQLFHLKFDEPPGNGPIITYHLELMALAKKDVLISFCITRSRHEKRNYKFISPPLGLGKYAFRLRANSIARYGPFTEDHQFEIREKGVPEASSHSWVSFIIFLLFVLGIFIPTLVLHRKYPGFHKILLKNPLPWLRQFWSWLRQFWPWLRQYWRRLRASRQNEDQRPFIELDEMNVEQERQAEQEMIAELEEIAHEQRNVPEEEDDDEVGNAEEQLVVVELHNERV